MFYNGVFIPNMMMDFNINYSEIKKLNFIEIFDFTESYKYKMEVLANSQKER